MLLYHPSFKRYEGRYDEHGVLSCSLIVVLQSAFYDILKHKFKALRELDVCSYAFMGRLSNGGLNIENKSNMSLSSLAKYKVLTIKHFNGYKISKFISFRHDCGLNNYSNSCIFLLDESIFSLLTLEFPRFSMKNGISAVTSGMSSLGLRGRSCIIS